MALCFKSCVPPYTSISLMDPADATRRLSTTRCIRITTRRMSTTRCIRIHDCILERGKQGSTFSRTKRLFDFFFLEFCLPEGAAKKSPWLSAASFLRWRNSVSFCCSCIIIKKKWSCYISSIIIIFNTRMHVHTRIQVCVWVHVEVHIQVCMCT